MQGSGEVGRKMKSLYITFSDEDFEKLKKLKQELKEKSWERFILHLFQNWKIER
jgi:predicted CopG family antitoxin